MPSVELPAGEQQLDGQFFGGHVQARTRLLKPLKYTGTLDSFRSQDLTPVVGREYEGLQVRDLLRWGDEMIRDLAVTSEYAARDGWGLPRVDEPSRADLFSLPPQSLTTRRCIPARSRRHAQRDEGPDAADHRAVRMRESSRERARLENDSTTDLPCLFLGAQPESSGLHVHPLTEEGSELGDQISVISSEKQKKGGGLTHQLSDVSRFASAGWHTDISFEAVPSDYAMLKIHTLPPTGGDTLWASGYEIYDRLSPALRAMLEGLTATHDARFFLDEAARLGNPLRKGVRGNPLNQGDGLTAVHPVIRTNRMFSTTLRDHPSAWSFSLSWTR